MKKKLLFLLCCIAGLSTATAQGFPTISTDDVTKWYLIQFMNGGNAITAETANANITTAAATGSDAQLWKITGNASTGYTFTNKKGYTLYANSALKDQMIRAAASATGVYRFKINSTTNGSYSGGYEIQPASNTGISMNLWGGPAENRGVGLWNSGDQNNPVTFVDAASFEALGKISIIPQPAELTVNEGKLAVSSLNAITFPSEEIEKYVSDFAAMLAKTSGTTLTVKESGSEAATGEIWLTTDATLPAEGYTLNVSEKGIEIKAAAKAGFFYAIQTLKQLLPRDLFGSTLNSEAQWEFPYVSITDQPQFGHRGFMMDVARHFFDKDEVKKVLDIMALYKMNRFHWHLTDDQGWRIEIPEYPLLTEVGSIRSGSFTSPGDGSKFFDDTEYGRGMWFSQDDLREIVAYAAERNIDILPEIDMPGHMVAAVTAYPELSCDPNKEYSVRLDGGISQDVLNIGKDETIEFLKCVLDNVANIFPFPYIHIGGDECPTTQWQTNEDCLRRVQEEGLAGVHELQSWLVEELGTYLKEKHGKDIVVWDELLAHWTSENAVKPVIMAWNSLGLTATAADKGFKSIATPYSHVYIDFMQVGTDKTTIDEPYYGGWGDAHTNTLEEAYSLNPAGSLSGREEYCLGVQCNLWAETLNDDIELEYQLLPRMIAVAETGWLPSSKKNWTGFYKRLQSHDEILDLLGYTYAKHYIEPKEYTAAETAIMEAESILEKSIRGGVGYPAADIYDALKEAYTNVQGEDVTALTTAIANYKNAPITQPQEGKTYQIVSASTYYKRQYEGSTMYQNGDAVRFHYTPQTEPEELWKFEAATDGGYIMTNLFSGKQLIMGNYNTAIGMGDTGTAVRIDKATIATRDVTFVPGAVTISAVNGYNSAMTGSVKRLSAEPSGEVYAKDEAALCYNGTWKFIEITDFTTQLEGLVYKCEIIMLTAKPGEMNDYTQEALDYLQNSVISPAKDALAAGNVTEEQYNAFVALYNQFQMMERTSIAQGLSEDYYYYIYNVWFGKYAGYSNSNDLVSPQNKSSNDNMLWSIVKKPNGQIYIYNKATGTAAYPTSYNGEQAIKLGQEYAWTLDERTLDGKTGICIIDAAGNNSWYTNPSSWGYIITKPFWGACTWEFQKSQIEVPTSIVEIKESTTKESSIYDLQGNKLSKIITPGIYIIDREKTFVK